MLYTRIHACMHMCHILEAEEMDFNIIVPLVYLTPSTIIESLRLCILNFLYIYCFSLARDCCVVFYYLFIPPDVCMYVCMYIHMSIGN